MTISTHITRAAKAISFVLVFAALVVPMAQAGDIAVDDHWRDAPSAVDSTILSQDFRGDDWYRDAIATVLPQDFRGDDWFRDAAAAPSTILPQNFRGDDYYRDAAAAPSTILPQNFRGDDYYRDASAAAPSTILPQNFRGDDYYRDASSVSAPVTGTGLDWADVGIGAGSMLGALVLLTALSGLVLTARRRIRTLGHV